MSGPKVQLQNRKVQVWIQFRMNERCGPFFALSQFRPDGSKKNPFFIWICYSFVLSCFLDPFSILKWCGSKNFSKSPMHSGIFRLECVTMTKTRSDSNGLFRMLTQFCKWSFCVSQWFFQNHPNCEGLPNQKNCIWREQKPLNLDFTQNILRVNFAQ